MISQSRLFFISFILLWLSISVFTPITTQAKATQTTKAVPVETVIRVKRVLKTPEELSHVFGSVLWDRNFGDLGMGRCVTERDRTLLSTRLAMDSLLQPLVKSFPQSDEEFDTIWEYLKHIYLQVKNVPMSLTAFYDLTGGYLKSHLLPMMKISFYSGNVSLSTMKRITTLFDHCKAHLDTQGHGWASPCPELNNYKPTIFPLLLNASSDECNELITLDDTDEDMEDSQLLVNLPRVELEDNGKELVNILLPFHRRRVFNLRSTLSSFVFVRYFVAATKCHEISQVDQTNFNRRLYHWTKNHLMPHLSDEQLYPGLGGVLRVMRTLKTSDLDLNSLNLTHVPVKIKHSKRLEERREMGSNDANVDDPSQDHVNVELVSQDSNTTKVDKLQSTSTPHIKMFTEFMVWCSIIAGLVTSIFIACICCYRHCKKKKPIAPDSELPKDRRRKKAKSRRLEKILTHLPSHEPSNYSFSSDLSLSLRQKPKDYVRPVSTVAEVNEQKRKHEPKDDRKGINLNFLTGLTQRRSHGGDNQTQERTVERFKLNSDTESEEEIFSSQQIPLDPKRKSSFTNEAPSSKVIVEPLGESEEVNVAHPREQAGLTEPQIQPSDEIIEVGDKRQELKVIHPAKSFENISLASRSTMSIERRRYNLGSSSWDTVMSPSLNSE